MNGKLYFKTTTKMDNYNDRMKNNTRKLEKQKILLEDSVKILKETENIGVDTLKELKQQGDHIIDITELGKTLNHDLHDSSNSIRRIERNKIIEKIYIIGIIFLFIFFIIIILAFVCYGIYANYIKK